jgi:hypothetical protein
MVVNLLKELELKKQQLLEEQERLIEYIKENYQDFYIWLSTQKIDLSNVRLYSGNIAAAFAITISSSISPTAVQGADDTSLTEPPPVYEVKLIERTELTGLNETQKALLVWERYGPLIEQASNKYQVDPNLILATILVESGGDTNAIRQEPQINDASYGLGQILYGTARGIGHTGTPNDLFDPEINIELIARYHRRNMDVYGPELTPQQLTTAYNAGSPYNTPYYGHIQKFEHWYQQARQVIT